MASPLVDVIVPTYRRADLLPETLTSVANQSYGNWHCWIAEDGRTPETEKCVQPFCRDPRFTYYPGAHFGFPAGPRNRAIRAGRGEYIALLDDDDYWLGDKLAHQVDFLETHPDYVMVGVNALRWRGEPASEYHALTLYHEKVAEGEIRVQDLLRADCFIVASVLIRRQTLSHVGLFNETLNPSLGEDYEMWLRLAAVGKLWFTAKPHMLFRESDNDKYYDRRMSKAENYGMKARILANVLDGLGVPPLTDPEKKRFYGLVEKKRLKFIAGPGPLGAVRYGLSLLSRRLSCGR